MKDSIYCLPEGTVLDNRYELNQVLGAGGYGITYKGRDMRLDRDVAIKEYYPSFWASRFADRELNVSCRKDKRELYDKGMERFLQEAKTLVSLSHIPEVVNVSDFFQENQTAYLVMDYLEGQNLKQLTKGFGGKIPPEVLIPFLEPLVGALAKMHEMGTIHRDISPDNIMMLEDGSVRLIDFGNARDLVSGESLTLAMKEGFAAPEQYKTHGQGTYTDVYGLCATIYYCITGKLVPQALDRLTGTPFKAPSEMGIQIAPLWEEGLMKGLDLYVKERIQTMEELWDHMYGWTGGPYGLPPQEELWDHMYGWTGGPYGLPPQEEGGKTANNSNEIFHNDAEDYENTIRQDEINGRESQLEQSLMHGFERVRDICIRIYRKLKEM